MSRSYRTRYSALRLDAFERIGEETSEVVEHRSASLVVVRIVRPKFVRARSSDAQDETTELESLAVIIAQPPERMLRISPNTEREYRKALTAAGMLEGDPNDLPELALATSARLPGQAAEPPAAVQELT